MSPGAALDRMEEIARRAGQVALSHYGRASFELKDDASPVSVADREVEDLLRRELAALDPDAAYIGEETAADPAEVRRARDAERVWIVDPIDGTAAYVGELDAFAVCIGLLERGEPAAGVAVLPALSQSFAAARGGGAWWTTPRGRREIHARPDEVRSISCLFAPSNAHRSYRIRYPGKVRSMGSTAYHFLLVARGVGVGAVSRSHVWDWVAAAAVLNEAGGVMRHLDGTAIDWRGLLDGRSDDQAALGAHPDRWDELAALIRRD